MQILELVEVTHLHFILSYKWASASSSMFWRLLFEVIVILHVLYMRS